MLVQGQWHGCYRDGWQGLIVPDAFAHPAKFSRNLIARIYEHMRDEGWLPEGSTVLDPFGGVALGALDAMRLGCSWVGVELEEKFVKLGTENIIYWHRRFGTMPKWGDAVLVHGDSRKLLAWNFAGPKVEAVVGSPPYSERHSYADDRTIQAVEKLKANPNSRIGGTRIHDNAGQHPSNLGNLPDKGFEAAIGSPPYADQPGSPSIGSVNKDQWGREGKDIVQRRGLERGYPDSPGQLAAMPEGAFEGVVSSPPYEASLSRDQDDAGHRAHRIRIGRNPDSPGSHPTCRYSDNLDDLGNSSGNTFWLAARQILEQVYLCVKPGAHAVWVVKHFVRKGKLVDFPDQWRQLCEAVGFRTLHCHRAWLVEDNGTQITEGGEQRLTKERKSFFRRLAERKGAPRIDWEMVWCMERPPLGRG